MPAFICETCGSQFTPSDAPPRSCPICEDERQFVPPGGQRWTTLEALARRHFNCYQQHESGLIGVGRPPARWCSCSARSRKGFEARHQRRRGIEISIV